MGRQTDRQGGSNVLGVVRVTAGEGELCGCMAARKIRVSYVVF